MLGGLTNLTELDICNNQLTGAHSARFIPADTISLFSSPVVVCFFYAPTEFLSPFSLQGISLPFETLLI